MFKELSLRLLPADAADADALRAAALRAARAEGFPPSRIAAIHILRRSIDARQRSPHIVLRLRLDLTTLTPSPSDPSDPSPSDPSPLVIPAQAGTCQSSLSPSPSPSSSSSSSSAPPILYPSAPPPPAVQPLAPEAPSAIVVGAGPAGLFAALRLVERGIRPILIERGKAVRERKRDLALLSRQGILDPDSNFAFGEGGAGAFSDGKLHTRSHKRGPVETILQTLCAFGASPDILIDAHPHIGSDKLPLIIERIRHHLLASGAQIHFSTPLASLLLSPTADATRKQYPRLRATGGVIGIRTASGQEFYGPVILATGHSARDVYRHLHALGIPLQPKPIAIGLRLEHPQPLINRLRYHSPCCELPPAEYSFAMQVEGRGVYTFCMCPGGFVIPASTSPEHLVVNGMSPSRRNSPYGNAAIVVELPLTDLPSSDLPSSPSPSPLHPLSVMYYQEYLEHLSWQQACGLGAPAQRLTDFCESKASSSLPPSSYLPGLTPSPLHQWLPPSLTQRIRTALLRFDRLHPGFLSSEAVLIAIETRTSAPVRIPRDPLLGHVPSHPGLFPAGEGAGQAGGIISAALDGRQAASLLHFGGGGTEMIDRFLPAQE